MQALFKAINLAVTSWFEQITISTSGVFFYSNLLWKLWKTRRAEEQSVSNY